MEYFFDGAYCLEYFMGQIVHMRKRTIYNKYHEKFRRWFNDIENFIDDSQLEQWGEYLSKRIPKEEQFSLYYYTKYGFMNESGRTEYPKYDELYVSKINSMNDAYEGVGV